MVMKTKSKSKTVKKAVTRSSGTAKSIRLNAESRKTSSRNGSKPSAKTSARRATKPAKVETRRAPVAAAVSSPRAAAPERRSKHFANAIQAYEAGLKLMHGEEFEKAIRCFEDLINDHPEEPEIQERAKV